MLRVVFDTVVFVRALLNLKSVPGRVVFDYADRYQLVLSTPLVIEILQVMARDEIVGKLERRRHTYLEAIAELLETFKHAQAVKTTNSSLQPLKLRLTIWSVKTETFWTWLSMKVFGL